MKHGALILKTCVDSPESVMEYLRKDVLADLSKNRKTGRSFWVL